MRIYLGFILLFLCSFIQKEEIENFYLLKYFNPENLYPFDKELLDSALSVYHGEEEDSLRIKGLATIAENLYDDA